MSDESSKIEVRGLIASFSGRRVLGPIDLSVASHQVFSIIGPSGCGKTTLIRCLNRLHELVSAAKVEGSVFLDGEDIYSEDYPITGLRQRVGMVFQEPNPFPTMSIRENVLAGFRLTQRQPSRSESEIVEDTLRKAALWHEVKDVLGRRAIELSQGQRQRLCIARCLAVEPDVILMDEPCSSLDRIATARIEDLLQQLRKQYTVIIVTQNLQQAARVAQATAFFLHGELIESAPTDQLFTSPGDPRTEDFITGKFD